MVICPDCGKDVKDAKFCSNCGALLPKIEDVEETAEEVVITDIESEPIDEAVNMDVDVESIDEDVVMDIEENPDEDFDDEIKTQSALDVPEEIIDDGSSNGQSAKSTFCPKCGTEIKQNAQFCPHCGFKLTQDESPRTKFCQNCGKKIDINAEICPHCGVRVAGIVRSGEKSVALAAILSFLFPGLGHLYNGLTRKGVSFIIAYIVSALLMLIVIGWILVLIVWIWALIDAIRTTESINRGEFVDDKLF